MGIIGFIVSLVSAVLLLVGLIPFLGWLNWLTTIPAAVTGAILSGISLGRSRSHNPVALTGLIISAAVFVIAVFRLSLGGGFF